MNDLVGAANTSVGSAGGESAQLSVPLVVCAAQLAKASATLAVPPVACAAESAEAWANQADVKQALGANAEQNWQAG